MSVAAESFGRSPGLDFIRSPGMERDQDSAIPGVIWLWVTGSSTPPAPWNDPARYFWSDGVFSDTNYNLFPAQDFPGQRQIYSLRGVWEGWPAGLAIGSQTNQSNSIVRLTARTATSNPLNTVSGIAHNEPGTFRFNKLVDIAVSQTAGRVGGQNSQGLVLGVNILRVVAFRGVMNLNIGCEPDVFFLNNTLQFQALGTMKQAFNMTFQSAYDSADTTPFIVSDVEAPMRCAP